MFSAQRLVPRTSRSLRSRYLALALLVVLATGGVPEVSRLEQVARATHDSGVVHRPLPPHMVEAYADGTLVALAYRLSYYCPTTPTSDLDGPFGHGDGHRQEVDPKEQHSHILEVTSSPPSWWRAVPTVVTDRSIWPDRDGRCPAGPPACLTSLAALRAAQRKGQVGPDVPTNAYFFFSVHPEAK